MHTRSIDYVDNIKVRIFLEYEGFSILYLMSSFRYLALFQNIISFRWECYEVSYIVGFRLRSLTDSYFFIVDYDILQLRQIKSLLGTKVEWLYYILEAFNSGDLVRYQELCQVHSAALCAQPALVENEKKLLEKINILCLMEIIFRYVRKPIFIKCYQLYMLFDFN